MRKALPPSLPSSIHPSIHIHTHTSVDSHHARYQSANCPRLGVLVLVSVCVLVFACTHVSACVRAHVFYLLVFLRKGKPSAVCSWQRMRFFFLPFFKQTTHNTALPTSPKQPQSFHSLSQHRLIKYSRHRRTANTGKREEKERESLESKEKPPPETTPSAFPEGCAPTLKKEHFLCLSSNQTSGIPQPYFLQRGRTHTQPEQPFRVSEPAHV